jgi:hypothetical protein
MRARLPSSANKAGYPSALLQRRSCSATSPLFEAVAPNAKRHAQNQTVQMVWPRSRSPHQVKQLPQGPGRVSRLTAAAAQERSPRHPPLPPSLPSSRLVLSRLFSSTLLVAPSALSRLAEIVAHWGCSETHPRPQNGPSSRTAVAGDQPLPQNSRCRCGRSRGLVGLSSARASLTSHTTASGNHGRRRWSPCRARRVLKYIAAPPLLVVWCAWKLRAHGPIIGTQTRRREDWAGLCPSSVGRIKSAGCPLLLLLHPNHPRDYSTV